MRIKHFFLATLFLLAFNAKATHNRAGEITYKWIGGLTYEAVITTYTKESAPADRCELTIDWGDNSSTVLKRDALDYYDIGYAFLPIGRRKGYATEATKLIIEYVKNHFKQKKVLAFTKPENESSQKLLRKIDFKYVGLQAVFGDAEDAVYEYEF